MDKNCDLECELQHEGYCLLYEMYNTNPNTCKAKTNDDLKEFDCEGQLI